MQKKVINTAIDATLLKNKQYLLKQTIKVLGKIVKIHKYV